MTMHSSWNSYPGPADMRWWKQGDAGAGVVATVRRIAEQQASRRDEFETYMSLCTDSQQSSVLPGNQGEGWSRFTYDPLSLNVVESVCATLQAAITKAKPQPKFLTSGGDWSLKRRVRRTNDFLAGLFSDLRVYRDVSPDIAYDMIRFGTGIAKVYAEHGKLCIERVKPWRIYVDDVDGESRKPRSIYQVAYIDRLVACELWPEHREALMATNGPTGEWAPTTLTTSDVLLVTEGWHLPSGPDADDGKHAIACGDVGVVDEPWDEEWFPFAVCRWSNAPDGWYGRGVPAQLVGIQYDINKTAATIDAMHDNAPCAIVVQRGSNITKAHIQNSFGAVLETDGAPPTVFSPTLVPPDMYAWLETQYRRAFERVGASQLAAHAQLPAGLRGASGVALSQYIDQTSERFLDPTEAFEDFHCQLATLAVDVMDRDGLHLEVVHARRGNVEKIKWSDVNLAPPYTVTIEPTSLLGTTAAGRLAKLQQITESGLADKIGMTPLMIMKTIDDADLASYTKLLTAPQDLVEKILEKICEDEEYIAPDASWPLDLCFQLGVLKLLEEQNDGAPLEVLGLLREWIVDVQALQERAKPPPAPMLPPPPPGEPIPAPDMNAALSGPVPSPVPGPVGAAALPTEQGDHPCRSSSRRRIRLARATSRRRSHRASRQSRPSRSVTPNSAAPRARSGGASDRRASGRSLRGGPRGAPALRRAAAVARRGRSLPRPHEGRGAPRAHVSVGRCRRVLRRGERDPRGRRATPAGTSRDDRGWADGGAAAES